MDYTKYVNEVLLQYSFVDPVVELIRHNENITYKLVEKGSEDSYLLRIHKPITANMQGVQNTQQAIHSELVFLLAWSAKSHLPVQAPVPNISGDLVTNVCIDNEKFNCSILKWIKGNILTKEDLNGEEPASKLGEYIAYLHQFSQSFQHSSNFMRPEYGVEWSNQVLDKLRSGEQLGVITTEYFHTIEQTFSLINDRLQLMGKTANTWGFIHADINYSNLIHTPQGISFIDFGLSGFGYYAMDVAMGALLTKSEYRDALISGYTRINSEAFDIEQLECFMFLAIVAYYGFLVSHKEMHEWIHKNIPDLIEHICQPLLIGEKVFYRI